MNIALATDRNAAFSFYRDIDAGVRVAGSYHGNPISGVVSEARLVGGSGSRASVKVTFDQPTRINIGGHVEERTTVNVDVDARDGVKRDRMMGNAALDNADFSNFLTVLDA